MIVEDGEDGGSIDWSVICFFEVAGFMKRLPFIRRHQVRQHGLPPETLFFVGAWRYDDTLGNSARYCWPNFYC